MGVLPEVRRGGGGSMSEHYRKNKEYDGCAGCVPVIAACAAVNGVTWWAASHLVMWVASLIAGGAA